MAITQTEFLAALETRSPAIHATLTSSTTLPITLSGEDILMAVIDSIHIAQKAINEVKTEPPYVNTVTRRVTSNPQQDLEGNIYILEERSISVKTNLIPGSSTSFTTQSI